MINHGSYSGANYSNYSTNQENRSYPISMILSVFDFASKESLSRAQSWLQSICKLFIQIPLRRLQLDPGSCHETIEKVGEEKVGSLYSSCSERFYINAERLAARRSCWVTGSVYPLGRAKYVREIYCSLDKSPHALHWSHRAGVDILYKI